MDRRRDLFSHRLILLKLFYANFFYNCYCDRHDGFLSGRYRWIFPREKSSVSQASVPWNTLLCSTRHYFATEKTNLLRRERRCCKIIEVFYAVGDANNAFASTTSLRIPMKTNGSRVTNYVANSLLYIPEIEKNIAETSPKFSLHEVSRRLNFVLFSHEDNVCQQYLFIWNVFG